MKFEYEAVEELQNKFDKLDMGKNSPIMEFILNKILPEYDEVEYELGNKEFFFELMESCYNVLTNSDFLPYMGFMKEVTIAVAALNLHYTVTRTSHRVFGLPSSTSLILKEKFDKDLSKIVRDPNMIYRFLNDVHVASSNVGTLTMSKKDDYRYPTLIRDIWLITAMDPKSFAYKWHHDYIYHTTLGVEEGITKSWRKAKMLFGKNGTYKKPITPFIASSNFYKNRINDTQEVLDARTDYLKSVIDYINQ